MANWDLTKGLQNLRAQVNAAFPNRDKTSDGTIGDKAHQAETSGHNPDDTPGSKPEWNGDDDANAEVRAWDMDSDLRAAPATAQQVVDHIRALPGVGNVLRYMIYNRKIYKAANGWKAEAYTGPSAHTEHIHFSGAYTQAADNNTTFDYRLEDLVALSAEDKTWLVSLLNGSAGDVVPRWSDTGGAVAKNDPNPTMTTASGLFYLGATAKRIENAVAALTGTVTALAAGGQVDVDELVAKLAPAVASAIVATLPPDRDDVTPAELQDAIVGALKILVDRPAV